MGKLVETSQWEEDLYQLETGDPVEGGPDGVSNKQAKQLGNRTRYLKAQVEQSQSGLAQHIAATDPHTQYATKSDLAAKLAALVGQSPQTLDTLKELADALGNDPNFATTIATQLGLKAPIDSPVFINAAKGPTPAQFDSSTKLSTTEFVLRELGGFSGFAGINKNTTLTNAQAGQAIQNYANASVTATLPLSSTMPIGKCITFFNNGSNGSVLTVATQGSDTITTVGANITTIPMQLGDTLKMMSRGSAEWDIVGGSAAIQYSQTRGVTAGQFDNSTKLATTAWYWNQIAAGVSSAGKVNGVNNPNLVFNGSGEFGSAGWTLNSFSPQADTSGAIGNFFANTGALSAFSGSSGSAQYPVGPSVAVTMSFDMANFATAGTVTAALAAYNSSGTFMSYVGTLVIPNGSALARYTISGTTPANTAYVAAYPINASGVTAAAFGIVFRRVKIEQGSTASLYSQDANFAALGTGPNSAPVFVSPATQSQHAVQLGQFLASLSSNGYIEIPVVVSGVKKTFIFQWNIVAAAGVGGVVVNYPIPFPNALLGNLATVSVPAGPVTQYAACVSGGLSSVTVAINTGTAAVLLVSFGY